MGTRENATARACGEVLDIFGVPWMRNNTGTTMGATRPISFGKPGWPDIIGCLPDGRFLGVECKAPEMLGLHRNKPAGRKSDLQAAVLSQLAASGALVMSVTSSQEMTDALRRNGYFH